MGSTRKHKEKDRQRDKDASYGRHHNKDKHVSESRSKAGDREKSDKSVSSSHRSANRYRDKESSSLRKRGRDSPADDVLASNSKKSKVKEDSKYSTTKVKLEENNFADNERNKRELNSAKNDSVKNESHSESSLSIEETNKLRVKLGLKPLQVDDNDGGKKSDNSKDDPKNKDEIPKPKEIFIKTENISSKLEAEKIKERIAIQREKRKIHEKLKNVKTLANDEDNSDDDAISWVKKNRKIQEEKERAAKKAKLLEEMDEEFGVSSLINEEIKTAKQKAYTEKHLKGLTIGHKEDEFKEGHQIILTLKDKAVLDEEVDVLENVNLVDEEKAHKNVENKLKRPEYRPYDEPEFDEFGILKKNTMLSKYDEEISGPKKNSFKLGVTNEDKQQELELIRLKLKQEENRISLVMPEMKLANEYYTHEEMVKFKKTKKIRKVVRKKDKELDNLNTLELVSDSADHGSRKNRTLDDNQTDKLEDNRKAVILENININEQSVTSAVDNDLYGIVLEEDEAEKELQHALHKARKLKIREDFSESTGFASIAKVAKTVKTLVKVEADDSSERNSSSTAQSISGNIILNSTAEFCRNLGDIPTYGMAGNRDEDEELLEFENEPEDKQNQIDSETNRGTWNEVELKEENEDEVEENEGQPILEEEPDVSVGLAGALKLAMKKGYLDKEMKKQVSAPRQSILQAQSYTIEEKFYEDDKVGRRERYNGPVSEFRDKDLYRPEIKLDYVDERGRVLDQKEAFRHLSHKFHGKGPGKNKIDKRMKKKDQESKLRQMSSTDTPLNTLKMLQEKQKELQSPFIVLTGGQKSIIQPTISKTKN